MALLVIFFIIIVPRPVSGWCGVMSNCKSAAEGTRLCVHYGCGCECVWVVRESLVGLCVFTLGGNQKDFVEGGGETKSTGGRDPRIAWPVLGTCTSAVCRSLCPFYHFSLLLFLFLFLWSFPL